MTKRKTRYDVGREVGMLQGMCIAVAHLLRRGDETAAGEIAGAGGIRLDEVATGGVVDEYDAKPIRKLLKTMKREEDRAAKEDRRRAHLKARTIKVSRLQLSDELAKAG